jgi:hypothetical protein
VEVLRSSSVSTMKKVPIMEGCQSGGRASPAKHGFLPSVGHVEVELRSVKAGPLGKDCCVDVGSSARSCRCCKEACLVGCSMGSRDCDETCFKKILKHFGVWLDWVSGIFSNLARAGPLLG